MEYTSTNIKSMVIDTIIKYPELDSTSIRKKIKIEFGYIMTIQEFENTINVKGKLIDCLDLNDGKYVFKDSHKSEVNLLKNGQPSFFDKEIYVIYSEKKSELDKLINQNLFDYNFKNIISKLKKECDLIEVEIVDKIHLYELSYEIVYNYLKKKNFHHFIDASSKIKDYLTAKNIVESSGYFKKERQNIKEEYKALCESIWKDGIISRNERNKLDKFCKLNKIDSISQHFLESEILGKLNILDLNFNEIINFYHTVENLSSIEIKNVIKKEYQQIIDIKKIDQVIKEIKNNKDSPNDYSNIKPSYSLNFNNNYIHVFTTENELNTFYSFEIAHIKNNINEDFKIIIKKDIVDRNNIYEISDIITDAICYKTNTGNNLHEFLEIKEFVKKQVRKQLIN
jgi:hypothetical protein